MSEEAVALSPTYMTLEINNNVRRQDSTSMSSVSVAAARGRQTKQHKSSSNRKSRSVRISLEARNQNRDETAAVSIELDDPLVMVDKVLEVLAARFPIDAFYQVLSEREDLIRDAVTNLSPNTRSRFSEMSPNTLSTAVADTLYKELIRVTPSPGQAVANEQRAEARVKLSNLIGEWIRGANIDTLTDLAQALSNEDAQKLAHVLEARGIRINNMPHDEKIFQEEGKWETLAEEELIADKETEHSKTISSGESVSSLSHERMEAQPTRELLIFQARTRFGQDYADFMARLPFEGLRTLVRAQHMGPEDVAKFVREYNCTEQEIVNIRSFMNDNVDSRYWCEEYIQLLSTIPPAPILPPQPLKEIETSVQPVADGFVTTQQTTITTTTVHHPPPSLTGVIQQLNAGPGLTQTVTTPSVLPSEPVPAATQASTVSARSSTQHIVTCNTGVEFTRYDEAAFNVQRILRHCYEVADIKTTWSTEVEEALEKENGHLRAQSMASLRSLFRSLAIPAILSTELKEDHAAQILKEHREIFLETALAVKTTVYQTIRSMLISLGFTSNIPENPENRSIPTEDTVAARTSDASGRNTIIDVYRLVKEAAVRLSIVALAESLIVESNDLCSISSLTSLLAIPVRDTSRRAPKSLRHYLEQKRAALLMLALNAAVDEIPWDNLVNQVIVDFVDVLFQTSSAEGSLHNAAVQRSVQPSAIPLVSKQQGKIRTQFTATAQMLPSINLQVSAPSMDRSESQQNVSSAQHPPMQSGTYIMPGPTSFPHSPSVSNTIYTNVQRPYAELGANLQLGSQEAKKPLESYQPNSRSSVENQLGVQRKIIHHRGSLNESGIAKNDQVNQNESTEIYAKSPLPSLQKTLPNAMLQHMATTYRTH